MTNVIQINIIDANREYIHTQGLWERVQPVQPGTQEEAHETRKGPSPRGFILIFSYYYFLGDGVFSTIFYVI